MCSMIEEMGNPFLEESEDLLVLDIRNLVDSSVAETIHKIEDVGKQQYENFVSERLEKRTVPSFGGDKEKQVSTFQPSYSPEEEVQRQASDRLTEAELRPIFMSGCFLSSP